MSNPKNVRIKPELVADLQKMADEKGLTFTGLVNMLLQKDIDEAKSLKRMQAHTAQYSGPHPYRSRERYGNSSTGIR